MNRAVASFAFLAAMLMGSAAHAETCEVKLADGSSAVWQGTCRGGMPYGKGKVTHDGRTDPAVVEDGGEDWVRIRLDNDGGDAGEGLAGRRPDRAGPQQGQSPGQNPQSGSGSPGGAASTGGSDKGDPAEDSETGNAHKFRNYTSTGSGTDNPDHPDRGEPAQKEEVPAPPATTASRSPETSERGASTLEEPADPRPVAAPCKLEVAEKLHDWSGPCTGDGKAYGDGRAIGPGGSTYTGSAQDGKRHGFGTVTTPDGGWYQGGFRDGLAHGEGMFRDENGEYFRARFENGKQVGEKVPVDYASIGAVEPDKAVRAGSGDEESEGWEDTARESQRDDWGPDTATAGSDRDGSGEDDPSYVAALGELEQRNAERRGEPQRLATRGADAAGDRTQEQTARRDPATPRGETRSGRTSAGYSTGGSTRSSSRRSGTTTFGGSGSARKPLEDLARRLRQQRERLARQRAAERKRQQYSYQRRLEQLRRQRIAQQRRVQQQRQQQLARQRQAQQQRQQQLAHQRRAQQQRQQQLARQRRVQQQKRARLEQQRRQKQERLARLARERDRRIASLKSAYSRAVSRCNRQRYGRSGCINHNRRYYNNEIRNVAANYRRMMSR